MHYSDAGVYPRSLAEHGFHFPHSISIHALSGSPVYIQALFAAAMLCAVALLLGYRTRWATVLSWFLLLSLQQRNRWLLLGADNVLQHWLFWAIFLPWGERFSIDGLRKRTEIAGNRILSVASIALHLQLVGMYWMAVAYKLKDPVWRHGEGVARSLGYANFAQPFAEHLQHLPHGGNEFTYPVMALQFFAPLLLWVPWKTPFFRVLCALILIFLHTMLGLALTLWIFPWACGIIMLAFLPSEVWRFGRQEPAPHNASPGKMAAINLICAFFVFITALHTMSSNARLYKHFLPERVKYGASLIGLDQRWNMFAPAPCKRSDFWFTVVATLQDGSEINVLQNGAPMVWKKPQCIGRSYGSFRTKRYIFSVFAMKRMEPKVALGNYYCREWNARNSGSRKAIRVEGYFMRGDPDAIKSKYFESPCDKA